MGGGLYVPPALPTEPDREEGLKAAKKKGGTEDGMYAKPKMIRNQSDYNPPGCGWLWTSAPK